MTGPDSTLTLRGAARAAFGPVLQSDWPAGTVVLGLIVLTLPLEVSKVLFTVEVLELSRLFMALGVALLSWRIAHRHWLPIPPGITFSTGLVIAVAAASTVATGWSGGVHELAAIVAYAGLALFVSQVVRSTVQLGAQAILLTISGGYVALVAIAQEVGGFYLGRSELAVAIDRRNATFADPNITARFFLVCLSALMALAAVFARLRWAQLTMAGLIGVALVLTFSRFGWIVAVALGMFWLAVALRWSRARFTIAVFGVAVVLALVVVPHAMQRAGDVTTAMTGGLGGGAPSDLGIGGRQSADARPTTLDAILRALPIDDERRYLLRAGLAMFEDHPLAGVGFGGFQPMILGPYLDYVPEDRRASPTTLPHTELAKTAAETGLLGLVALGIFVVAVAKVLIRLVRASELGVRAAGLALAAVFVTVLLGAQAEGRFWTEPYLWLAIGATGGLSGAGGAPWAVRLQAPHAG